jgi:ATP-binding cassette subfamily E protein 1
MVVEHDLTLLDYLSDFIEILYGEPAAYGIVASMLSTKVGINVFLDGYLPNENVRFRDAAFKFDAVNSTDEFMTIENIIEYPKLEKKFANFSLSIDAGRVRKSEVLGIVGANALGKTTMMKMIAGVEKPDSGNIESKVKIAYKPQYLTNDFDIEVITLLEKAHGGSIQETPEEEIIVNPMKIKKLYNKSVKNLSGGELQKVAIGACLLQKVDVYALDEPSAFLDVEDRIAVAKLIQRYVRSYGKSAIIVDHDIQLMDLIADSIVIFHGIPGREGQATAPKHKVDGMNEFLKSLEMTYRRDETSMRPRVNKLESRLDREQKLSGKFYYRN